MNNKIPVTDGKGIAYSHRFISFSPNIVIFVKIKNDRTKMQNKSLFCIHGVPSTVWKFSPHNSHNFFSDRVSLLVSTYIQAKKLALPGWEIAHIYLNYLKIFGIKKAFDVDICEVIRGYCYGE